MAPRGAGSIGIDTSAVGGLESQLELLFRGLASIENPVRAADPRFIVALRRNSQGKLIGLFQHEIAVEEEQALQGHERDVAFLIGDARIRKIEQRQVRSETEAADLAVDGAAPVVFVPFKRRAPSVFIEFAGDKQQRIAQSFGVEAASGKAP